MSAYILRRLLIAIPTLFGITLIVFIMVSLMPGDPFSAMIPPEEMIKLDRATLQQWKEELGLNDPIPVRYVKWLGQVVTGNLGYSIQYRQPVLSLILDRLRWTVFLMGLSLLLTMTIGIALGLISALKQYSALDYALTVFAFVGISVPSFFAALIVIFLFGVVLRVLPIGGMWTPGQPTRINLDFFKHLIMPLMTLVVLGMAGWMRMARTSVLDTLGADYIMTARAKGLREPAVILRHVMKNAMLPLVTMAGLSVPGLFGGSFFIEVVYSWPGMGLMGYMAFVQRDYPLQMGFALMGATMLLLANLFTDVAYALVDPRVAYK